MKKCVIVGGADISNYDKVKTYIDKADFIIYCDSGLKHRENLEAEPSLIVGDFDSFENPHLDVETIILPRAKDDTDTMYAVREAICRGFTDFLLVGVIGARLDHTLANLYILVFLYERGKKALIVDDYSQMEMVGKEPKEIGSEYGYFSLMNITGKMSGIYEEGSKFKLDNAMIKSDYQYGISNEVEEGKTAKVRVEDGAGLLIKVFR